MVGDITGAVLDDIGVSATSGVSSTILGVSATSAVR
jgi:hypothetical protein